MLPAPLYRSNLLLHKVLNRSAPPVHRLQSESRYFLPRESGLMTWNGLVGSMGLAASLLGCGPSAIQQQSQSAAGRLAPTRAVAVAPLRVPEELAGYESELARLDSLIFFELETAGLYVTGPKVYGRLWDKIASARGGFYNPLTGALNTALLDSAQAQLAAILDNAYGASAIVYPSIVVVPASYEGSKASWDGVSQGGGFDVIGAAVGILFRAVVGILFSAIFGTDDEDDEDDEDYEPEVETGVVPALSLLVLVQELDGSTLYEHRGGIEVFDPRWVDEDDVLKDGKRARKAVEVALKPFTEAIRDLPPISVAQAGP